MSNYISINNLYHLSRNPNIYMPTRDVTDWAILKKIGTRGRWSLNQTHYPILGLYIDTNNDGAADRFEGMGYMEHWLAPYTNVTLGGSTRVRQTLRPARDLTLKALHLSLGRYAGLGTLIAEIKDEDDNVLSQARFNAGQWPLATNVENCPYGRATYFCHTWGFAPLSSEVTLKGGERYHLELRTDYRSEYRFNLVRDGSQTARVGFPRETTFSEGQAEYSSDGGASWQGFSYWGIPDRREGDLEFFFDIER